MSNGNLSDRQDQRSIYIHYDDNKNSNFDLQNYTEDPRLRGSTSELCTSTFLAF